MSMGYGGHGKNSKSYAHVKKRPYCRKPNNGKDGRRRFYNKMPEGGYRSRVISQLRYIKQTSAGSIQMGNRSGEDFPPFGQRGEIMENRGKGDDQRRREKDMRQQDRYLQRSRNDLLF